jgi:hypothetical protein
MQTVLCPWMETVGKKLRLVRRSSQELYSRRQTALRRRAGAARKAQLVRELLWLDRAYLLTVNEPEVGCLLVAQEYRRSAFQPQLREVE